MGFSEISSSCYCGEVITAGTQELFRILPEVAAKINQANIAMEKWVDALGKTRQLRSLQNNTKDSTIKLLPDYGSLFATGNFNPGFIQQAQLYQNNHQPN